MKKAKTRKLRRVHKKTVKSTRKQHRSKPKVRKQKKAIKPVIAEVALPKKPRKPRSKKSGLMYFTQDTEDAINLYNKETCPIKRDEIYNTRIKYPFEKLVENIFNTFKFTYFETSPLDVQKETVSHLVVNIHKFESGKGKAFSYFSIIAKHYLIALNNSTYKRFNQHVDIGEEHDEHTVQLQTEDRHYKEAETQEFMRLMIEFWENNVGKIFTKQRDLDIANAVIELFRSSDRIDAFNKKALYLYIREISSCKTQQITKVINKMKQYQTNISRAYISTGSINTGNYIKVWRINPYLYLWGMDTDFELFKGKSFKELCQDIYSNHEKRKEQVDVFIADLRPLIKNVNDAMIIVPLIKGYLDTGNTNDEHLIRLAAIIQKIMTAAAQTEAEGGTFGLTEAEKKELMAEIDAIQKSDGIVVKKLTDEKK